MGERSRRLFPAPEANNFFRVAALPLRLLNRVIQCVEVEGAHNIPSEGPVLVVSNHTVHADAITVGAAVYEAGRAPSFVAASDFFAYPGLSFLLKNIEAVPVYRDSEQAKDALDGIRKAFEAGRVILLFPEGSFTRDPEQWPMKGKTGVARLMASNPEVAVIPLAHWGNEKLYNPWNHDIGWRYIGRRRTKLRVSIGEPISRVVPKDASYKELVEVTEHVMQTIEDLLVPLRQENPLGYPTTPRTRRWDVKIDGDPMSKEHEKNVAARQKVSRLWAKIKRSRS